MNLLELKGFSTGFTAIIILGLYNPSLANDDKNSSSQDIEEIVITGEKVARTLKDTSSSVSVISKDVLKSIADITLTDAVAQIPNVISLSGAIPDIRGVSGNGSAGGFNSISGGAKGRVSILIDGVAEPFVADLSGDSGLWDIEQIEVFRGPQSTNNGRNSIAGSIYIKTKDPTNNWEGATRIGYRNQENYIDTSAVISGPLVEDKLAFRLNLQRLEGDTITNDKEFESNPADYDLNKITTEKGRAKLKWSPRTDLTAMLTYSSNNEKGDTGRIYYKADNLDERNRLFFRNIETDSKTTSLDIDYELSESISLNMLVSKMDYKWGFDSYEPTPEAQQQLIFDEQNTTLDTRLNFGQNDEDISGFIGLAYFEREHDMNSTGSIIYFGKDKSDSKSVYGEVTFNLPLNLELTTGARMEEESQLRDFTYPPVSDTLDQDHSIFLPKIVLQYKVNDQNTLALSARKGYNAGGGALNITAEEYYYFDEETVNTFEFSTRSRLAESAVFLSTNLFYNIYDGYQAVGSTRRIVNMDEVVTYGAELEVSVDLNTKLDLTAGIGLLHTEIKNAGEEYLGVAGNELNSAPNFTGNLGIKYHFTNSFNAKISANYVDEYYGDFSNTNERVAGDYTIIRFSTNYELENWLISGFINNLTDEEGIITNEPASRPYPTGYAAIVQPRTIGASVTYSF